jgi:hypothetical protein
LEAFEVYQEYLSECLTILITCGGSYEAIANYLEISDYMVELAVATYFNHLLQDATPVQNIETDDHYAIIYADFSSTKLSKKISIIMGEINGQTVFKLVPSINSVTAWDFMLNLKNTLSTGPKTKIIIVTDDELA